MADRTVYSGISIRETAGREGTDGYDGSSTATRTFLLKGSSDPTACRAALIDGPVAIDTYDGLARKSISRQRIADEAWEFTVSYDEIAKNPGDYSISIDTTGGTERRMTSFTQTSYAASGETATDFKKSIEVRDGVASGVDVVVPSLKVTVSAKIAATYVTSPEAYTEIMYGLTGKVNASTFLGFAAKTLLFLGATGGLIQDDPQLTFSFEAAPNVTGLAVGGITGIAHSGHDHVWFDFATEKDSSNNRISSKPIAAYVEEVYQTGNFSLLSIGLT